VTTDAAISEEKDAGQEKEIANHCFHKKNFCFWLGLFICMYYTILNSIKSIYLSVSNNPENRLYLVHDSIRRG
jgi:hypothetical protein